MQGEGGKVNKEPISSICIRKNVHTQVVAFTGGAIEE